MLRSQPMSDAVYRAVAGPPPGAPRPTEPPFGSGQAVVAPGPPGPPDSGQPLPPVGPNAAPQPAVAPAARENSVRMVSVNKSYPNGKKALIDIDLVIPEGDFVFLVGPSGAGKSTLVKLLVRDEKATQGTVEVAGHDLGRMKRKEVPLLRRKIGIVFQDSSLDALMTVHETLWLHGRLFGLGGNALRGRIDELLDLYELANR